VVTEVDGTSVHQDEVDFRVRDPKTFDHVFDGPSGRADMLELSPPALFG